MRVLSARMLSLLAGALVMISLLITMPLGSLASAEVMAQAGDAVAIAGDDDCDVETNDAQTNGTETNDLGTNGTQEGDVVTEEDILGAVEDLLGMEGTNGTEEGAVGTEDIFGTGNGDANIQTQNGGGDTGVPTTQDGVQNNGDQTQDEVVNGGVQQTQDGNDNGNRVEARAGDAVAVAAEDCDFQTNTMRVQDSNTDNVVVEGDGEIQDRTGQPDGNTLDTSNLDTLPPEILGGSDELQTDGNTTQENELGLSRQLLETNDPGQQLRRQGSGRQPGQLGSLSLSNTDWPLPRRSELDQIGRPRRFDPKPGTTMTLSIKALGLSDVPVTNSNTQQAFDQGLVHVRDTANPWDKEDQKNVFIAGHRLGAPGKESRLVFYRLDELKPRDEIVVKNRRGRSYEYRVRDVFKVDANDAWAADTLVGRDLLTLETYTIPNLEDRIIVRADRVRSNPGQERKADRLQPNSGQEKKADRLRPNLGQKKVDRVQPSSGQKKGADGIQSNSSQKKSADGVQLNSSQKKKVDHVRPRSGQEKKRG